MRIVAGEWRGRKLAVPAGAVRPTADRVREAWMSIVQLALPGATVLDLCSGSGALGIEALSRGASHATFVESDAEVLRTLRANIATVGAGARSTVVPTDALRFVTARRAGAYDIAFADPPYDSDLAAALAERWLAVPFAGVLGVEHASRKSPPAGGDTRRYGDTAITFYRVPVRPLHERMIRTAIYAGSFDPPTNGHIDLIHRSLGFVDRVVVGVLNNLSKSPLLDRKSTRLNSSHSDRSRMPSSA